MRMPSVSQHRTIANRKRSRMFASAPVAKRAAPLPTTQQTATSVPQPPTVSSIPKTEASSTAKEPVPEPAPLATLKSIFSRTDGGKRLLKRPAKAIFVKPTQKAVDAYNVRAVRAIREKNVPMLRTMLEEGVSLDACNRFGESLIHMACRRGDVNVVKFLLLEGRVDLSVRDDFGRTPVHDACWTSEPNFAVMDVLLEHAPTDLLLAEDVRGHTPFHYARKEHWDSWVSYFNEREAKISSLVNLGCAAQRVVG